jgi:hypothetical protein
MPDPTQFCESTIHDSPAGEVIHARFNPSTCLSETEYAGIALPLYAMVSFAQLLRTREFQDAADV